MDPDLPSKKPLSLSSIIRQHARPSFVDSVDDEKRLCVDYQVNPRWKRGQFCWEAKGPVAENYTRLEPQITHELNQAREESSTEVFISLYMVGKDVVHAKPMIIVSSMDRKSRENAKMAIQRSGIITGTDFSLGSMSHQPSGRINPVATRYDVDTDDPNQTTPYEILFNPSEQIRLVGMPIYIRHSMNHIRQATANAVYNGSRYGFMTAAHALEKIEADIQPASDDDENLDIPFDDSSDEENDDDVEMEISSQYSETSLEASESEQPIISLSQSSSSSSHSKPQTMPAEPLFSSKKPHAHKDRANDFVASVFDVHFIESLKTLGRVSSVSTAVDCVVVTVTDTEALKTLHGLHSALEDLSSPTIAEKAKRLKIVAWSVHGPLSGNLMETPVLMHLRNSSSYEIVYKFTYQDDGRVRLGDCGALVTDVGGLVLYGHVIANSEHSCVAFMIAAKGLIPELETAGKWSLLDIMDRRPGQQAPESSIQISDIKVTKSAASETSKDTVIPQTDSPGGETLLRPSWLASWLSAKTAKVEASGFKGDLRNSDSVLGSPKNISDADLFTLGGYSDLFATFAACVNGYELIVDAYKHSKHHEDVYICYVWMKLEEHRLLDWAKTIMLDFEDTGLRPSRSIHRALMRILEEKKSLLHLFGGFDERSQQVAHPDLQQTRGEFIIGSSTGILSGEASFVSFPQTLLVTKVQEFNNRHQKVLRRLDWISFTGDKMKTWIGHLMRCNDELQDALDKKKQGRLLQEQLRTMYQIVALNHTAENLLRIIHSSRTGRPSPYATEFYEDARHRLVIQSFAQDSQTDLLLALVQLALATLQSRKEDNGPDSFQRISLKQASEEINDDSLDMRDISVAERWTDIDDMERTGGMSKEQNIWIEWRSLKMFWWRYGVMERERECERERIILLVALLKKMNTIDQFRVAECLGYIQDEANFRYGIVFNKPEHTAYYWSPQTLRTLLDGSGPPLGDRVTLMQHLCETVEMFHAIDWLHEGLRSSNVLLFSDPQTQSINFADPCLSGFEDAHPAARGDIRLRLSEHVDTRVYRHPRVQQNSDTRGFVKSYDLYALGIVLLEIAHWQPIEGILDIDLSRENVSTVRERLLEEPQYSDYVRQHLGATVESAIWSCLRGPEGFGMEPDCDETDVATAANLLREFGERVVMKLIEVEEVLTREQNEA